MKEKPTKSVKPVKDRGVATKTKEAPAITEVKTKTEQKPVTKKSIETTKQAKTSAFPGISPKEAKELEKLGIKITDSPDLWAYAAGSLSALGIDTGLIATPTAVPYTAYSLAASGKQIPAQKPKGAEVAKPSREGQPDRAKSLEPNKIQEPTTIIRPKVVNKEDITSKPSPEAEEVKLPQPSGKPAPASKETPVPTPEPVPEPEPQPEPQPEPAPGKTKKPVPSILPLGDRGKKEKKKKKHRLPTITWWQADLSGWYVLYPPYNRKNTKLLRKPPKGAKIVTGRADAYRTIQAIGGDTNVVLDLDMGNQDVLIRKPSRKPGKKGAIRFRKDARLRTKGDFSLKGIKLTG